MTKIPPDDIPIALVSLALSAAARHLSPCPQESDALHARRYLRAGVATTAHLMGFWWWVLLLWDLLHTWHVLFDFSGIKRRAICARWRWINPSSVVSVITNAAASDSHLRVGPVAASPCCSKPKAEDFLRKTSSQIDVYHYEPTNYDWKVLEYLQ
jgi:hypothetical protein